MVTFCAEFNSNFENWWLFWVYFLKSISSTKTGNLKVFQFDSRNNYGFLYRISILNFPNYQQKKILLKVERLKDFSPLFCTVILIWRSLLKLSRRKKPSHLCWKYPLVYPDCPKEVTWTKFRWVRILHEQSKLLPRV